MDFLGIIPARYASTRFPGKPLVKIGSKTMIQRVYEQVSLALESVTVATDDGKIYEHVKSFGGNVVMTCDTHKSGTDRCAEALKKYHELFGKNIDVVINIQGDEPFIRPEQIEKIKNCFCTPDTQIATLVKPIVSVNDVFDENKPKVIVNNQNEAIYFSRSPIPFLRGVRPELWADKHKYLKHIGIYGYRSDVLFEIVKLSQSKLELAESLEQLRWIENNFKILVAYTDFESMSVDTPEDLEKILKTELVDF